MVDKRILLIYQTQYSNHTHGHMVAYQQPILSTLLFLAL